MSAERASDLEGWFEMKSAADLMRKLERDFERLRENPRDAMSAFDFFVTAYHLKDWVEEDIDPSDHPILQVCGHLANGAKHFKAERWEEDGPVQDGMREGGAFSEEFGPGFDIGELIVELRGDKAEQFGRKIEITELASKALEFWQERIELQ